MARKVNYASIGAQTAQLSTPFGVEWATKLFGADTIATLPRLKSGPRKGAIKGYIVWYTATRGGWDHRWGAVKPGIVRAVLADDYYGTIPMRAAWMGSFFDMSLDIHYLFDEGRARKQCEIDAHAASLAAERAEYEQDRAAQRS